MKKGFVCEADIFAGKQLKKLRRSRGFSQSMLAESLGITFQQVQKYEAGKNRLSAGRIFSIANFFNVTVMYFFEIPIKELQIAENFRKCHNRHKNILVSLSQTYSRDNHVQGLVGDLIE